MQDVATEVKSEIEVDAKKQGQQVAFIIAFEDFRDEEYFVPKEILEKAGVELITVSTSQGTARGADGGEVEVDLALNQLEPGQYQAVAFIGGPGALDYLDNEDSYKIAEQVVAQDKILAAICISPVILAKAGVLENKEVTVWSSSMNKEPIETVEDHGAHYHDRSVVIDKNIVTADGPQSAKKFGEALIHALTKTSF